MLDYESDDSFDGILAGPVVNHRECSKAVLPPSCDGSKWPHDDPAKAWGESPGWAQPSLIQTTHEVLIGTKALAGDAWRAAEMKYADFVIVTPNATWIPEYPLLDENGIVKHEDGFWGGHEYTMWPQLHSQNFSHHACIPSTRDSDSGLPVARNDASDSGIHFYDPVRGKDFVTHLEDCEQLTGTQLGTFNRELIATLDKAFWTVSGKTQRMGGIRGIQDMDGDSRKVYQRCIRTYRAAVERMESLRMSWREALSTWRDAQRASLELRGLHTFLEKVVPRIDGEQDNSDSVLPVRGAFTTQSATVHQLYRIGIPVWYICPSRQFKGKVYGICDLTPWKEVLSPVVMKFKGRPILDGLEYRLDGHMREDSVNHFLGDNHIRGLLDEIYKFQSTDLSVIRKRPRSPTPPGSSVTEPGREPASGIRGNAEVCRRTKTESENGRVGATSPRSVKRMRAAKSKPEPNVNYARILHIPNSIGGEPDQPPCHPIVMQCLKSLAPIPDDRTHPALYPFPPPFLLIHPDVEKTAELYLNYIRIRPDLIDMVVEGTYFDKSVWRKMRDWRVILHGDYMKSTPLAPNTTSPFVKKIYDRMPQASPSRARSHKYGPEDTPLAKQRRVADIATIKVVLHAERRLEPFDKSKEQTWRQMQVSTDVLKSDRAVRMEVQWELCELLFRCEFFALDNAMVPRENMSPGDIQRRGVEIGKIFNPDTRQWRDNFRDAIVPNLDLQLEYWDDQVCLEDDCMIALKSILSTWPGFKVDVTHDFRYLISFYVQTFVEHFKRMPTLHCKVPTSLYKKRLYY